MASLKIIYKMYKIHIGTQKQFLKTIGIGRH